MNTSRHSYHWLSKTLHWAVAGMIVLQYLLAELAERAEATDQALKQLALLANHKSVGITLLALATLRLLWRRIKPPPPLPSTMPGWQVRASHISHWALYLLLFLLPVTGWMMSSASAYAVSWFNLVQLPDLVAASPDLKDSLKLIHETLAKALFAVALIHILAAIKHGVVDRDGVLQRILSVVSVVLFLAVVAGGAFFLTEPQRHGRAAADAPETTPAARNPAVDSEPGPAGVSANLETRSELPAWQIDYEKSHIRFVGDQAGASFEGVWTSWEADIRFQGEALDASAFDVKIDARKVDTQDEDRDSTMQDSDWFDTTSHPFAYYRATQFRRQQDSSYVAEGELTIKGVPSAVALNFTVTAEGEKRVLQATSQSRLLVGTALLDRLALGLGTGEWEDTTWVGQEVEVKVRVEAVVQGDQ